MKENRNLEDSVFFAQMAKRGWSNTAAAAQAEAKVYSITNNPYLSKRDLALVECVYGFPYGVFDISILALWILSGYSFFVSFLIGGTVSLLARALRSFINPNNIFFATICAFLIGKTSNVIQISVAIYMIYLGKYAESVFCIAAVLGLTSLITPVMILDSMSRGMAVQWKIAKRVLNVELPFEKYL